MEDFKEKNSRTGKWSQENAGGNISERLFTSNPFYYITVTQPNTQIFCQLTCPLPSVPLGSYAFYLGEKTKALNELSQADFDTCVCNNVFSCKKNSLYIDCANKTGRYLVVPCTFNSRTFCDFVLGISSTKPVDIIEGANINYTFSRHFTLGLVNPRNYNFANTPTTLSEL